MSVSKGYRREKQAKDLLEETGFKVYRKPNTKYGDNDIYNLFDIVALDKKLNSWYIQVKSNTTAGALKNIKKSLNYPSDYKLNSYFQVWVCKDYKGWRIYYLSNEWEFIRIVDEPAEDVHTGENVLKYLKTQNSLD